MTSIDQNDSLAAQRFLSGAASLDDAIDQAFSELPRKIRGIIRRWAVQDEPYKRGMPILVKTLAKKSRLSRATVHNYLFMAKTENPKIFALLQQYRAQRARKTGGYEVK